MEAFFGEVVKYRTLSIHTCKEIEELAYLKKDSQMEETKSKVRRKDRNEEIKYEKELGVKKKRYNFSNWKGKSFP